MELISFSVKEFQSYRGAQPVTIGPRLTLVAGRNNVGKSALLRAMRVSLEKQQGAREGFEVGYSWRVSTPELLELTLNPGDSSVEFEQWAAERNDSVLTARFRTKSMPEVGPDSIFLSSLELPEEGKRAAGGDDGVHPRWEAGTWAGSAYLDLFARLPSRLMSRVSFITPRRIEQGARGLSPSSRLEPDGRNLTEVLLHLQMNYPTTKFRSLVEFMSEAFPEIETLTVMSSSEHQTMGELGVLYEGLGDPIPLRLCGSGVEQMLSLAIGVLTAPDAQLFLIDEPQAYLHPHAERSLLQLLDDHEEHQYVIATHYGGHAICNNSVSRPVRGRAVRKACFFSAAINSCSASFRASLSRSRADIEAARSQSSDRFKSLGESPSRTNGGNSANIKTWPTCPTP